MLFPKYPYLYSCSTCGAKANVTTDKVKRSCNHTTTINAPRKVILTGDGTLNSVPYKVQFSWHLRRFLTWVTGRCI
jgi:hypothetical protein